MQAGSRRTASRRAEPLPTLAHAKRLSARSDGRHNSHNTDNSDNADNSDNSHSGESSHYSGNSHTRTHSRRPPASRRHQPPLANAASIITCVPCENSSGQGYGMPSRTVRLNAAACSS